MSLPGTTITLARTPAPDSTSPSKARDERSSAGRARDFDRFGRSADSHHDGTGLALSIVRQVVHASRGEVTLDAASLTIIIATASAVGGTGPLNSAAQAAEALKPVAGQNAELLFALGLIGASALAGAVVPLSASYAIGEAAGVERSVSRSFRDTPLFLGLFTAQIVLGATVALTPVDVIQLRIGTQVLQGLISPVVLVYLLVLTNRRCVLGPAANGSRYRIAATAVVVGVGAMSTILLAQTVLGWFGLT
ncbi:divalent metal cation transporter [Streptomyces sp. NPDC001107]